MIVPALVCDFLTEVHREKIEKIPDLARCVCEYIDENVPYLNEEIAKDFHVHILDNQFIKNYLNNLETLKLFILTSANNLQDTLEILESELYYIYKNMQWEYCDVYNLDVSLKTNRDACEACQFLSHGNYDLKYHLNGDSCKSYLVLNPELNSFVNIIHPSSNLYRVPTKYRIPIESYLNYLNLKGIKTKKENICYFLSPDEYNLDCDILYVRKDAKIYLKFRQKNYKEDLLRVILSVTESEESRKLFYDLSREKNTTASDPFINFLARQNSLDFIRESMIAYLLNPDALRQCSEKTYEFMRSVLI